MTVLLLFAFLSGLVTIFAPCIWPLLPIILSATSTGGKKKPLGITLGLIISFGLLTLSIAYLIKIIPFDPNSLRLFAVVVIGFLGLTLVVPRLSANLEGFVSRLAGKIKPTQRGSGFLSGFITGGALGIVWTPCAGPILATIATLSATQSVNYSVVLITTSYVIGIGIPLFLFATLGNNFFSKSKILSRYTGRVQQFFGLVMIVTAILIFTNYDKVLQAKLLDAIPSYSNFLIGLESNQKVKDQLKLLKNNKKEKSFNFFTQMNLFNANYQAPEFVGITKWLNTDGPLSIESLRGKVVLVDFWTYTCINCIRTLPYVTSWYEKYKDKGFVVIGVHTPEFEFEKDTQNVLNAISQYKITYPVAQDNDYETWNAYDNLYWPAEYLIDKDGRVRRTHFGEGEYDQTEMAIQKLLEEKGTVAKESLVEIEEQTPRMALTPETYLGSDRIDRFASEQSVKPGLRAYTAPVSLPLHYFAYEGKWDIQDEYSVGKEKSKIILHFKANKVFLVMHPAGNNDFVKVSLDNKEAAFVKIDEPKLYELINLKGENGEHILKIELGTDDIKVFAFTFG